MFSQTVISAAKVAIRSSYSRYVAQFFGNFQMTFMVVYGSFKIFQTEMGVAKTGIRNSLSRFVTRFFRN